ncbi:hypothetical protein FRB96_003717 [Tulasnella sp. 330]|nr:hypothetical protein FRB96_003717 [Tulasnella sp. 330]
MHTLKTSFDSHHIPSGVSVDTVGVEFETILSEAVNELSTGFIVLAERVQSDYRRTDLVEWNRYSLSVHRQRIFLWSGKLHTWRLPVPELWPDVLQKIKALGMNVISIYAHRRPIIAVRMENEHINQGDVGFPGKLEMTVQLKEALLLGSIDVPLTINDAYMGKNCVNGSGSRDIYGILTANTEKWDLVLKNHWDLCREANPGYPLYIPEFQGWAYDAWHAFVLQNGSIRNSTTAGLQSDHPATIFDNQDVFGALLKNPKTGTEFYLLKIAYGNSTNNKNIVSEADDYHLFPEGSVGRQKKTF